MKADEVAKIIKGEGFVKEQNEITIGDMVRSLSDDELSRLYILYRRIIRRTKDTESERDKIIKITSAFYDEITKRKEVGTEITGDFLDELVVELDSKIEKEK